MMDTTELLCSFNYIKYPRPPQKTDNGFMIVSYVAGKNQKLENGTDISRKPFTAIGYELPTASGIEYRLHGEWKKSQHGTQLSVTYYEEVVEATEAGIKAYLSSGLIKGIGPKTADAIYKKFGDESLTVLDANPERLMEVPGIKGKTFEKILTSYMSMRGARDVVTILAPYNISIRKCVEIYKRYGVHSVTLIRNNPYKLCEMSGFGFLTADRIGKAAGIDPTSTHRISAGILHVLKEAETGGQLFKDSSGHLCLTRTQVIEKTQQLLATSDLSDQLIDRVLVKLIKQKDLIYRMNDSVFRIQTDEAEGSVAKNIAKILSGKCKQFKKIKSDILNAEIDNGCKLAPEQKEAVKTTLSNTLTIVTGGPGTGKTMIQQFILQVFRKNFPKGNVLLMAPTGRAARRMTESTGEYASTIHKALGLQITTDDGEMSPEEIDDVDLIIVDEISMLDIFLADALFKAIRPGTRVLLVGDSDQLPSVGPGAVLADLIESGVIPTVRLTKVYRQASTSLIAVNAAKMRKANAEMETGQDFVFISAEDFSMAANIMEDMYVGEVEQHGVDNVVILAPFRSKTDSGVNAMNERLQTRLNPLVPGALEVKRGKKAIRQNDRVMITKNQGALANGDIGYVTRVYESDNETVALIDFGDGRELECTASNLGDIELAYATTIHKSQGSEYKIVICNIMSGHHIMLKRNLIYTAVTRAKKKVIIVGERHAYYKAVKTEDTSKRQTLLVERIRHYCHQQIAKAE
jgi:exodeoxyribonuclease V alpha subunit